MPSPDGSSPPSRQRNRGILGEVFLVAAEIVLPSQTPLRHDVVPVCDELHSRVQSGIVAVQFHFS